MFIPAELTKNIMAIYGEQGRQWLQDLPEFLVCCEQAWHLRLEPCYQHLSFHYVAPGVLLDGTRVVLKCSPPNAGFHHEIAALEHFNGMGAVKLLRADAAQGSMLLEHIHPGSSLEQLRHTQEAVTVSAAVIKQLHKPLLSSVLFPSIQDWLRGFENLRQRFKGGTGPFPKDLIDRAEQISKDLLVSSGEQVLLHGDLHDENILFSKERGWLAIDPKGVIGEREFELPLPKLNECFTRVQLEEIIKQFIDATGFDIKRVAGWLCVKAVLAAWWVFEDTGEPGSQFIALAEYVQSLDLRE